MSLSTQSHELDQVEPPPEFNLGEGLVLRAMTAADSDPLYALHDANRQFLATYLDYAADYTHERAAEDYAKAEQDMAKGVSVNYVILADDKAVGTVGMGFVTDERAALGYWLAEDAQGKGIATRAAQALVDFAFTTKHLESVVMLIKPENEASKHLAARLGARIIGQREEVREGNTIIFDVWEVRPDGTK